MSAYGLLGGVMTRFEIVKKALDDLWELIAETDEERIAKVTEAQRQLSNKYFNLNQKDCVIDYSSPATQFAYIFTYTGAHADIVYQLITKLHFLKGLPLTDAFHLISLGGGPGSDMLGVMKFFEKFKGKDIKFTHNSFDKEPSWSHCWASIAAGCIEDSIYKQILPTFHVQDVTDKIFRIKQYLNANLCTLTYFLSEIQSIKDEAAYFMSKFFNNISIGSYIIIVDNDMDEVKNYVKELIDNKFNILAESSEDMRLSWDEDKIVLSGYMSKLNRYPRLTAKAYYCIAQKIS